MNCNTTHYRANSSSVPGDPTQVTAGWSDSWAGDGYHESLSLTVHISPGGLSAHNRDADFAASSTGRVNSAFYSYYDIAYAGDFVLKGPWRYVTTLNLQLADRPLIDTEQFALGGEGGARTYVYDDGSFDTGGVWRNELRGPALPLPRSAIATSPYLYLDGAYGQDLRGGARQFAGSAGLGLDWALGGHLSGGLAGGWSLADAPYTRAGRFKFMARVTTSF